MIVLELNFPVGRYHATPWGRHVNEGAVEWPPSQWRVLRGLIATWHLKAREISETTVRSLVEKLSAPPRFHLPRASASHTRHYMPLGSEKTTKVFDTFIQIEAGSAIFVEWDIELGGEELAALQTLAARLGYFGRAESLVVASVRADLPRQHAETHSISIPVSGSESLPAGTELVRLLVPTTSGAYSAWRDDFMRKALAELGPKPSAAQTKKLPVLPENLFDALHADTGELQAAGWNLPPGAQFANYVRDEKAFAPGLRPRSRLAPVRPTVARFSVASVVPPVITRALAVGEQVHKVLCSENISDGHTVFTGAEGQDHQHAHIFSESIDDAQARITHLSVYAPEGFDDRAVEALRKMQWTWGFKGHDLRTVLHGIGQPGDFDCLLFAASRVWRSYTPFVATRHAKTYRDGRPKMDENGWQIGSAPHDLLRLLALNSQWQGAKIRKCLNEREGPFEFGSRKMRSLQFQTQRHHGGGKRGHHPGAGFVIEFPEPVSGPIAVGYGSHLGLGLFVPVGAP